MGNAVVFVGGVYGVVFVMVEVARFRQVIF